MAAAVRPKRDDCGDDLGGDARKFGYEYGGESRAVGAFIASVAAGSGDRVEVGRPFRALMKERVIRSSREMADRREL